jgi:hypothetical protein
MSDVLRLGDHQEEKLPLFQDKPVAGQKLFLFTKLKPAGVRSRKY